MISVLNETLGQRVFNAYKTSAKWIHGKKDAAEKVYNDYTTTEPQNQVERLKKMVAGKPGEESELEKAGVTRKSFSALIDKLSPKVFDPSGKVSDAVPLGEKIKSHLDLVSLKPDSALSNVGHSLKDTVTNPYGAVALATGAGLGAYKYYKHRQEKKNK